MDIKEKLQDLVESVTKKLKEDPSLLSSFKKEPIKVIEKVIGIDLPDEQIEKLITMVKAKLAADDLADKADDVKDVLKGIGGLFGKKKRYRLMRYLFFYFVRFRTISRRSSSAGSTQPANKAAIRISRAVSGSHRNTSPPK